MTTGGPGGSGIDSLKDSRKEFEGIFGTEYNFISFDPRGVGATGPKLSCGGYAVQPLPTAPLGEKWAQSEANGENCTANAPFTYKYVGTVANVRDMIYFTQLQAKAKGEDPEQAKIWYYGISYGTVIGQTLAALYPKRLGRILLDGNVDGTEHYTGFAPSAVLDTDKAFEFFFDYCARAGEEFCPLANKSSTASDVQDRYDALLNRLEYQPYILPNSTTIIKRDTINSWGYSAMYGPGGKFYDFAVQVAKVENETLSQEDLGGGDSDSSDDSLQIITCVDTADRYALKSLEDYEKGVDLMRNRSYYGFLDIATGNALFCNGMGIMPPQSQIFPGFSVTNTSVPILFINTSGDPITPLASAKKMAGYFPGSVVLTVHAPGHSYSQTKSECANNHVRNYMRDATLPKEGAVCEDTLSPITIFNQTQTPTSTDVPEIPNIPTPTSAVKR